MVPFGHVSAGRVSGEAEAPALSALLRLEQRGKGALLRHSPAVWPQASQLSSLFSSPGLERIGLNDLQGAVWDFNMPPVFLFS